MRTKIFLAIAMLALAAGGISSFAVEADREQALANAVQKAIESKDAVALEKLVYWEGATDGGKDFFKKLLETSLEIKVQNVEVIPLPPGKTGPPTTLPVTHLLKITGTEGEGPSRQMYPVGEKDGKMYLACAMDAPRGMR